MPGVAGFSGSPPYIEPPVRHVEKLWTEKKADVEGSAKKKQRRRNWGISRREYNKKLRNAGKLPSVWEQSTDQKGLGPLSDDEVDEHEDDKGDIFSSGRKTQMMQIIRRRAIQIMMTKKVIPI